MNSLRVKCSWREIVKLHRSFIDNKTILQISASINDSITDDQISPLCKTPLNNYIIDLNGVEDGGRRRK